MPKQRVEIHSTEVPSTELKEMFSRVDWIATQPFYETGVISRDDAILIIAALKAHYAL